MQACYPSFHLVFAPSVGTAVDQRILRSNCPVESDGNIRCAPEAMRADAERQLQSSGFWPSNKLLDLATYTLARNIQSEVGDGTVEERVALAESTINQGLRRGAPTPQQAVLKAALYAQPSRLYGAINAPDGGSLRSGRFTSTSRDPSILSTLIADFVIRGGSRNFAQGADDQDGLEYQSSFSDPIKRILQYAKESSYWVGPLPGVDHWKLTLFRKYNVSPSSPEGLALIQRAKVYFSIAAYENGKVVRALRPVWPANLPICTAPDAKEPTSPGKQILVAFTLTAGFAAAAWLIRRSVSATTST